MPPIFKLLVSDTNMKTEDAYNTFNMGIGMVIAVSPDMESDVLAAAKELGEQPYVIGSVQEGEGVRLCG